MPDDLDDAFADMDQLDLDLGDVPMADVAFEFPDVTVNDVELGQEEELRVVADVLAKGEGVSRDYLKSLWDTGHWVTIVFASSQQGAFFLKHAGWPMTRTGYVDGVALGEAMGILVPPPPLLPPLDVKHRGTPDRLLIPQDWHPSRRVTQEPPADDDAIERIQFALEALPAKDKRREGLQFALDLLLEEGE